jgi:hypothetical protein
MYVQNCTRSVPFLPTGIADTTVPIADIGTVPEVLSVLSVDSVRYADFLQK